MTDNNPLPGRRPHHIHIFMQKEDDLVLNMLGGERFTRLFCYSDSCYDGESRLNREMYPPELIGPKLQVIK